MSHTEHHPLRGQTVHLLIAGTTLMDFEVEDWADRVSQRYADLGDDLVYGHESTTREAKVFRDDQIQVRHAH